MRGIYEHRAGMRIFRRSIAVTLTLGAAAAAGTAQEAVATPTVSPAVKRSFAGYQPRATCRYGYLCAFVYADGGYYKFELTRCNTRYRVSGWHGRGFIVNSQFGGVTARFFTRSEYLYASRTSRGYSSINWEPVWSLRVC